MSVKSCSKMKDDDVDEGFEDASCATLHESHYTRTNQGFKQDSDEEDVDPVSKLIRSCLSLNLFLSFNFCYTFILTL